MSKDRTFWYGRVAIEAPSKTAADKLALADYTQMSFQADPLVYKWNEHTVIAWADLGCGGATYIIIDPQTLNGIVNCCTHGMCGTAEHALRQGRKHLAQNLDEPRIVHPDDLDEWQSNQNTINEFTAKYRQYISLGCTKEQAYAKAHGF